MRKLPSEIVLHKLLNGPKAALIQEGALFYIYIKKQAKQSKSLKTMNSTECIYSMNSIFFCIYLNVNIFIVGIICYQSVTVSPK